MAKYWSIQRARAYGMGDVGFIPLIVGALSAGAAIYQKKKESDAQKKAEKDAKKAAEAAARQRSGGVGGMSKTQKYLLIGGGVLAVGVVGYMLLKRRR